MNDLITNKKFRFLYLFAAIFFTILVWIRMLHFADICGYFVDESIHFTAAASNFFKHLNYTGVSFSHPFDPRMSSGIIASWPTGLSWNAGFSLFAQRVILIIYEWGQFLLATYILFRRENFAPWIAFFLSTFLWMFFLRHSPNSMAFIQNLGELQAGLCLLWAVVLFRYYPVWAFFALGLGVWLAKLVFLPAAFALGATYWLSTAKWEVKEFKRPIIFILAFFLPVILWIFLISLRFGWDGLIQWLIEYHRFVFIEGPSGLDGSKPLSLAERLMKTEWASYVWSLKGKMLIYFFAPIFLAPILLIRGARWEKWAAIFIPVITAVYAYWWFLHNPDMYLRHSQPALFLGFGFIFWVVFTLARGLFLRNERITIMILFCIVVLSTMLEMRLLFKESWPIFQPGVSYARACSGDISSKICAPGMYPSP